MFEKDSLLTKLTTDDLNELKGFEELIQYWTEPSLKKGYQKRNAIPSIDYMEIINFLENENKRIRMIYNLLHNILPNLESFDQKDSLIEQENIRLTKTKKEVLKRTCKENGVFQNALSEIFNKAYSFN
ncbi:MAG: hypothetical protein CME68_08280 [Halobacteriovoraceae bacterium]|nr:hypothetical protein [Halobacteriovoraceae bacterium]